MAKFFLISPIVLLFSLSSWSLYPLPQYEIVVVETTPSLVQLTMSLSQIAEANEASELQQSRKRVYAVTSQHIIPLLTSSDFTDGYNLVNLASQIPASEILGELLAESQGKYNGTAVDFSVLILPKRPESESAQSEMPYAHYYSTNNKAAVIDSRPVNPFESDYTALLNKRVSKTMEFLYNRNFLELGSKEPFFVGALLQLHLEGDKSYIKSQMVGSVPSNLEYPFSQVEPQAEFKAIRLPRVPVSQKYRENFQGGIIEFVHTPHNEYPPLLKIKFGNIGKISRQGWDLIDNLGNSDSKKSESSGQLGVRSYARRFNVPNIFGEIRDASGFGPLDLGLSSLYNIQINIHEIMLDLEALKIIKMRTTVELPVKEYGWVTEVLEPGLRFPTVEVPFITQQVMDGGNQKIEPYREQYQDYINMGEEFFSDSNKQTKLINLILSIFESQSEVSS